MTTPAVPVVNTFGSGGRVTAEIEPPPGMAFRPDAEALLLMRLQWHVGVALRGLDLFEPAPFALARGDGTSQ